MPNVDEETQDLINTFRTRCPHLVKGMLNKKKKVEVVRKWSSIKYTKEDFGDSINIELLTKIENNLIDFESFKIW